LIAFNAAVFSFLEMVQDGGLMLLGDWIGLEFHFFPHEQKGEASSKPDLCKSKKEMVYSDPLRKRTGLLEESVN
jgi:hypothetical protein